MTAVRACGMLCSIPIAWFYENGENAVMKTCPECSSTDIIPDLLLFADEACSGQHPPYVQL
jgi:hypothetical protein